MESQNSEKKRWKKTKKNEIKKKGNLYFQHCSKDPQFFFLKAKADKKDARSATKKMKLQEGEQFASIFEFRKTDRQLVPPFHTSFKWYQMKTKIRIFGSIIRIFLICVLFLLLWTPFGSLSCSLFEQWLTRNVSFVPRPSTQWNVFDLGTMTGTSGVLSALSARSSLISELLRFSSLFLYFSPFVFINFWNRIKKAKFIATSVSPCPRPHKLLIVWI